MLLVYEVNASVHTLMKTIHVFVLRESSLYGVVESFLLLLLLYGFVHAWLYMYMVCYFELGRI